MRKVIIVESEEELQQFIARFHPLDQCIARFHFQEYGKVFLEDDGKPVADAERLQRAASGDFQEEKENTDYADAKPSQRDPNQGWEF